MKNKTVLAKAALHAACLLPCLGLLSEAAAQAANVWAVDAKGNITLNGTPFRVKGGSWFGLEGRHEPPGDATNPSGAPMEMYLGNMSWSESGRTLERNAADIKALGFNAIRIPLSPQTLNDNDPQGRSPYLKNAEAVRIQGAYSALKATVQACAKAGLYVMLDLHSCSNYVGWRAGRLDARPPYVDATRIGYEYTREEYSCSETGNPSTVKHIHAYNTTKWLADLKKLAGLGAEIGVDNIMGIDIFNEPWDYSWPEWKDLIDQAYTAISSVNPNILIFAQGIGGTNGSQDGSPTSTAVTPHGSLASNPNWGENLYDAGKNPPTMPKSKLVYSPHTYGPAVFVQKMFADPSQPECATIEGDAFADKKCQIVINQKTLDLGWHEHFGYLKAMGYAIAIGEYGGNMDWPRKAGSHAESIFGYLTDKNTDEKWQNAFVDYLMREGIFDSFYWSINPESADTYGIYTTTFDPVSNKSGWGTWGSIDNRKMSLLQKLWAAPEVANPGQAASVHGVSKQRPFSFSATSAGNISYALPQAQNVSMKLYKLDGSLHADLISKHQDAGFYSLDLQQMKVKPGIYVVSFKAGNQTQSQKIYLGR